MESKRLGMLLIVFSLIFLAFVLYFNNSLSSEFGEYCSMTEDCIKLDRSISITHFGFGFFGFMIGLGFYILFFSKSEERIMNRLEREKDSKLAEEKFELILKALDSYEKKIMKLIKEQDGITQNTLLLRSDMSKSKLSYVLSELEKRGLIKRVSKGKSLEVYLKV